MPKNCQIKKSIFGTAPNGEKVFLYTLTGNNGLIAKIISLGGILKELHVPDNNGNYANVVLGFDNIAAYLEENIYAGAIVGRIAGRLTKGKLKIGEKTYRLPQNEGETHLHGGVKGLDKRLWEALIVQTIDGEALKLSYHSPDGEEGYPGNLDITVTYSLTPENGIRIDFEARTDKPTALCPTNHTYFNLAGEGIGNICNHIVRIASDLIVEVGQDFLPTGNFKDVTFGINDFREPAPIAQVLQRDSQQAHGDFYILKDSNGILRKVASVDEPKNGRLMEVFTNTLGLQFYTGSFLGTKAKGKSGAAYGKYAGVCLECQRFPNAQNHAGLKSIILVPEERFYQSTEYRFPIS